MASRLKRFDCSFVFCHTGRRSTADLSTLVHGTWNNYDHIGYHRKKESQSNFDERDSLKRGSPDNNDIGFTIGGLVLIGVLQRSIGILFSESCLHVKRFSQV
jgi:hypothetical protein